MNAQVLVAGERTAKRDVAVMPSPVNPDATPMQMLAIMTQRGVSIADLKELVLLARDWEANQARKAFVTAMANFKKNPPKVIKDLTNKQYGSMYTSLGNLVNTVNAFLGEHGLNATFPLQQTDTTIRVKCRLTHVLGHSEEVELAAPPDTSGAKNPLQQIKSTLTYLKGATFEAITGIVASNQGNDDGNASGKAPQREAEPDGYESWALDMEALADEGLAKLQEAWKKTNDAFRRYTVKYEDSWWSTLKNKAGKVKVTA